VRDKYQFIGTQRKRSSTPQRHTTFLICFYFPLKPAIEHVPGQKQIPQRLLIRLVLKAIISIKTTRQIPQMVRVRGAPKASDIVPAIIILIG